MIQNVVSFNSWLSLKSHSREAESRLIGCSKPKSRSSRTFACLPLLVGGENDLIPLSVGLTAVVTTISISAISDLDGSRRENILFSVSLGFCPGKDGCA